MNVKTSIIVALFAIVAITSVVDGAPGELGDQCYGPNPYFFLVPGAIPLTFCSDKACAVPTFYRTGCNAGLNCCGGNAPATTTTSSTTTTTTVKPEETTTTTTTTKAAE